MDNVYPAFLNTLILLLLFLSIGPYAFKLFTQLLQKTIKTTTQMQISHVVLLQRYIYQPLNTMEQPYSDIYTPQKEHRGDKNESSIVPSQQEVS